MAKATAQAAPKHHLRAILREKEWTHKRLADALGIEPPHMSKIMNGSNQLSLTLARRAATALDVSIERIVDDPMSLADEAALESTSASPAQRPAPNVRYPDAQPNLPSRQDMPQDIEVLGSVQGGDDGEFMFNGDVVDRMRRPPGLAHASGVYALYVTNDSMSPRYFAGEPVFVSTKRPVAIGDFVIIQMHPDEGETAGRGFLKRLVARRGNKIIVSQYNPELEIEFDVREVKSLHRVYMPAELYGV